MARPQTLDSEALRALRPTFEPFVLQRKASDWLAQLSDKAGSFRFAGALELPPFEMLRSPLSLSCGHALADLDLVNTITREFGETPVSLNTSAGDRIEQIARWAGVRSITAASRPRLRSRVREVAYVIREELRRTLSLATRPPRDCFALAVPRMPGHVNDIMPVALELRRSNLDTVFAANAIAGAIAERGFTHVPQDSVSARAVGPVVPRLMRFAADALSEARSGSKQDQLLAETAWRQLRTLVLSLAHMTLGLHAVVRACRPRVVIAGNIYTMEGRTAALMARSMGLRSAVLEHGTIFGVDPAWERCPADLVLAWGEPSRRSLLASGLRPEQIAVVGAPRTDAFVRAAPRGPRRRALVASSGAGHQVTHVEHALFIETIYAAAERTPDVDWVIKLHPKDSPALYATAAARHPLARVEIVRSNGLRDGLSIFEHLARSGALVTVVSTSALDAMVVGVPVVCLLADPARTPQRMSRIEFLQRGTVRVVTTPSALADAVLDGVEGPVPLISERADQYASEHYANRGSAAEAAAAELRALAE